MTTGITLDSKSKKAVVSMKGIKGLSVKGIRRAFYFIGKDLHSDAKVRIKEKPKSGRVYRVKRGSRVFKHTASAPGEAPANLTGNLRDSINFKVQGSDHLEFGSSAEYAEYLENGTRKIKKRPFLIRAIKEKNRNIIDHFVAEITREIKK